MHGEQLVVLLIGQNCNPGTASSARINNAINPPMKKNTMQATMYMMPINL